MASGDGNRPRRTAGGRGPGSWPTAVGTRCLILRLALLCHKIGKCIDRDEYLLAHLFVGYDDPELLLEGHHQLQGVDGIQPQSVAEERDRRP